LPGTAGLTPRADHVDAELTRATEGLGQELVDPARLAERLDPGSRVIRRFEGKVVVITGGGAGIGACFGRRFAREGASVALVDVNVQAAQSVATEIEETGARALALAADVRDVEAISGVAAAVVDELGAVDVLVNNAGIHLEHAQLRYTLDAISQWRDVLDVNVLGALTCVAAFRDAIAARGGGAVLNMSSMAAYGAGGAYAVSKLALNSLTVCLASELGAANIRVNGVAPGLVDSEASVAWWSAPEQRGLREALVNAQVLKRQGLMEDVANMGLFLCSNEASFVTGQTIIVDGGFTKKPY
jgi:NAD(P)-dependent dehydrogenase (short-subunit alcohol dehydrogenase family)